MSEPGIWTVQEDLAPRSTDGSQAVWSGRRRGRGNRRSWRAGRGIVAVVSWAEQEERRRALADALRFVPPAGPSPVVEVLESKAGEGFVSRRIRYEAQDGDVVPAYLIEPATSHDSPGVVVFHQHASQWHLGKSEVAGLGGDRWQAFGPELARAGLVVLAPDSIAFEDRRHDVTGTDPHDNDWLQHYNEMAYRLLRDDTLMRKVLADAADALSVLIGLAGVIDDRVGVLGHSYGGNSVLFHAAVDDRVRFAVASGAACSFSTKIADRTGIEMSEILPGFLSRFEVDDLVRAIAPNPLLLVSAQDDKYSRDAPAVALRATDAYREHDAEAELESLHFSGGHELDEARFRAIVDWTAATANRLAEQS